MFELNIWFIAFLISFAYLLITKFTQDEISVKKALKYLKKYLVRLIIFYQSNYSEEDQIVLIKKWLSQVDINKVSQEQLRLLKEYVDSLQK